MGIVRFIIQTQYTMSGTMKKDRIHRQCLKCGDEFIANSKCNRICEQCSINNRKIIMTGYPVRKDETESYKAEHRITSC